MFQAANEREWIKNKRTKYWKRNIHHGSPENFQRVGKVYPKTLQQGGQH